ncbi:hypothetical protein [Aquisalimonas sp.]|uniref:hypothetical protein n=1 Tax=Aquisalimonas sp. TaxID=1872621 RepID=UPI0025C25EC4|nr:hypothetical protein [Aquisalimonas sp.]
MAPQEYGTQLATVQEVKEISEKDLLALAHVQGVGIGFKESKGKLTKELTVVVYVDEKLPEDKLHKGDIVPKSLKVSVPAGEVEAVTDVQAIGRLEAQTFNARIRPLKPGYSIGHPNVTAGTFGCLVREVCPPCRVYILSNNHVLANSNAASIGDPILQPGAVDGGTLPADIVARLARFVPIRVGHPDRYNLVDAALALPTDQRLVIASVVGLGIPTGTVEATLGMDVVKSGRTTQTTTGQVVGIDATVAVSFDAGTAYFRNQILTTNMSQGGDSGSLLMSRADRKATGLLFAGSSEVTVHNNIANVLMALGVEIVTA